MSQHRAERIRLGLTALSVAILLLVATIVLWGQTPARPMSSVMDGMQDLEIQAIEKRLDKMDALHVEALAEAVRAQGEAIKTQQTLLWGVLAAVLINIIGNNMRQSPFAPRRRKEEEES